jgi:hypothetical protein
MVSCLGGGIVVAAAHFFTHNDLDEILPWDLMSSLNHFCSPLLLFYVLIPHYTNHSCVLHFSALLSLHLGLRLLVYFLILNVNAQVGLEMGGPIEDLLYELDGGIGGHSCEFLMRMTSYLGTWRF